METKNTNKLKQQQQPQEEEDEEDPKNNHHPCEQQDEEFAEEFQCCICLDLLYKPVVLACGHLSCFWCIYNGMNLVYESSCPYCRQPYNHFPSVCQLLHFLLLKMYPIAYKRRERQVGEEEKQMGYFSPQFDHEVFASHSNQEVDVPSKLLHRSTNPAGQHCLQACFSGQRGVSSSENLPAATTHDNEVLDTTSSTVSRSPEGTESTSTEHCSLSGEELECRKKQCSVSVSDLQCAECKNLLFRPVVLNCGHVYCETCIFTPKEETPKCQICQSLHPNGFPGVCFVLQHFLEEHFPEMYAKRQEGSVQIQHPAKQPSRSPGSVYSFLFGSGSPVHIGVGCDSCGMTPIMGQRYKCTDCVEKIGFDLCEACYKKPSKILGRFNQQHKPEHKFEVVPARQIMFVTEADEGFNIPEGGDVPQVVEHGSNNEQAVSEASDEEDSFMPASV